MLAICAFLLAYLFILLFLFSPRCFLCYYLSHQDGCYFFCNFAIFHPDACYICYFAIFVSPTCLLFLLFFVAILLFFFKIVVMCVGNLSNSTF